MNKYCAVLMLVAFAVQGFGQTGKFTKADLLKSVAVVPQAVACPTRDLKHVQQEKMREFDKATQLEIWHKSIDLQKNAPGISISQRMLIDRAVKATLDNPGFTDREPQPNFYNTKEGKDLANCY